MDFKSSLLDLQLEQYEHDAKYHQDITGMLPPLRMTHITLHICKYLGSFIKASREQNAELLKKGIIDTAIIVLSGANCLQVNLTDRLKENAAVIHPKLALEWENLFYDYAEIAGSMAKACEAIDHAENFPSRQVLEASLIKLVVVVDDMAKCCDVDLGSSICKRWAGIESKSVLFPPVMKTGKSVRKMS